MLELSLFSGAGGGLLGTSLLGWTHIGAVEIDEWCCGILEARQRDGCLGEFPIWNMDIQDFNARVAPTYTGMVDVITAGFPCQPFSSAGKRAGPDDPRNQWPATIECVRVVRPCYVYLENVPGLITSGYFGTILRDLAKSGYDARWRILSAAELGAPHRRDRLWIVANASGSNDARWNGPRRKKQVQSRRGYRWDTEPDVGRVANGVASRVDRLKAIGNGQVPAVVAAAWRLLTADLEQEAKA